MAEIAIARRYARALFNTAERAGTVDSILEDLQAIDHVLRSVPALQRAFRNPTIPDEQKQALLRRAFGGRVSATTSRFLEMVVERRRETILGHMYEEFQRLTQEARNIMPVDVTAATPLTDAEREQLAEALNRRTGKLVVLKVGIDPELMGGVVVRMGDTVIDGSVRTKLLQLKSRLLAGPIG